MSQSRKHSFIESWANVFIGWCINFCIQLTLFPALGIPVTMSQNLTISAVFTVVSITRSYCLRRWFNQITVASRGSQ